MLLGFRKIKEKFLQTVELMVYCRTPSKGSHRIFCAQTPIFSAGTVIAQ